MATDFPGFFTPRAGFEVPLEMLAACHLRMADQIATLQRLVPHLIEHGSDAEAQTAARRVLRYFDTSARDHHADEEDDLFPALIESMAGSDAVCLRGIVSALGAEHRELEARWQRLRPVLQQVAEGEAVRLDADEVQAFAGHYQRHIAREEAELLPMARRLLTDSELDRIGAAMRARRAVN
jgi:hemerythrin-like domain-containing protein